jgi:hypothetical protein
MAKRSRATARENPDWRRKGKTAKLFVADSGPDISSLEPAALAVVAHGTAS